MRRGKRRVRDGAPCPVGDPVRVPLRVYPTPWAILMRISTGMCRVVSQPGVWA